MIKKLDMKSNKTAMKVLALQKVSYQIEAEIIGFYDIPPLKDTLETIMKCNESFYGYIIDDEIVGIISYRKRGSILDIHRVAIHPNYFRRGIAQELLNFIEKIDKDVKKIIVCTGKNNKPAVNIYIKNDYKIIEDIKIKENLFLTKFEKILK